MPEAGRGVGLRRHEFGRAIHGFIADGAGAGGPFAVFVEKELPEALLHPALIAIGTGEGRGIAFEIEEVWRENAGWFVKCRVNAL